MLAGRERSQHDRCGGRRGVGRGAGCHGQRAGYGRLLRDVHRALGDEDLEVGTGELHVERGADRPHIEAGRAHDEGARGIFRDGKLCLALHKQHAALGG